jgi:hypothetical protein
MFASSGVEFLPPGCVLRVDEVTQTLAINYPDGRRIKCSQGEGLSKALATPVRRATRHGQQASQWLGDFVQGFRAELYGQPLLGEFADLDDGRAG